MVNATQRKNGRAVLSVVEDRAHKEGWSKYRAQRVARMVMMCCFTESNLYVYANKNIPASMELPHDAVGSDHASVGMFQQQVPMWGTVQACMDPKTSCTKFLDALAEKHLDLYDGPRLRMRIQAVQESYDSTGMNYAKNYWRARFFVARNWDFDTRTVKTR